MIEPQSRQLDLRDVELSADLRLPLHADGLVILIDLLAGRLVEVIDWVGRDVARRRSILVLI
ncbi:hypothetical protein PS903_02873 [Pseudomonas fluorescens]|nr:hypothetical protein PS903_02873 [Pseudomonas fluorescens]